jgi:hypothetical protein
MSNREILAAPPTEVHLDLNSGVLTDTGMKFSFHVPGHGVVLAAAGSFCFLPDGTEIGHGLDLFSPELCDVLA